MESLPRYYRVERDRIAFLKFILEAYEGITVLSTLDSERGIVMLSIAPGCEMETEAVLDDLKKDLLIEPVSGKAGSDFLNDVTTG
jgi:hypothetical protein